MITRRDFIKNAGWTVAALKLAPMFVSQGVWAAVGGTRKKTLVVIFQRGAMDGLSLVPPIGDVNYYQARPHIAIPATGDKAALKLDGYYGLHPAYSSLIDHWNNGSLAFVHHVGSPNVTRSHFDAQDFMEAGTDGLKNLQDGFLNRAMRQVTPSMSSRLRAVALQNSMPRSLRGDFPAISMNSIHEFGVHSELAKQTELSGFEAMYKQAANHVLQGQGGDAFAALKLVDQKVKDLKESDKDQRYPKTPIAKHLREIAELVKSDVGLQLAVTEMDGWDTHVNQGSSEGQLADRFRELSEAQAAFAADLGARMTDVCVVTMTEFGRTVKENGDRGTDHGHASVMSILGGPVAGKKIYGAWKDLSSTELFEGRDVPVSTDYRNVFSELLGKHLGIAEFAQIFPAYNVQSANWLGVLRG